MLAGLPPAPRWAWVAMALGVVAIAVMSWLAVNRPPPPGFTAPAAARAGEESTAWEHWLVQAPDGATFGRLAQDAGSDFDVVVFFGSRADSAPAPAVEAAAEATFAAVREASPDADLLVIGPAWPGVPPPSSIVADRDAVAAAATTAAASFTDPLAEDWLTAPGSVGPNGVGLTPEGQRFLADRIRPLVDQALPADG